MGMTIEEALADFESRLSSGTESTLVGVANEYITFLRNNDIDYADYIDDSFAPIGERSFDNKLSENFTRQNIINADPDITEPELDSAILQLNIEILRQDVIKRTDNFDRFNNLFVDSEKISDATKAAYDTFQVNGQPLGQSAWYGSFLQEYFGDGTWADQSFDFVLGSEHYTSKRDTFIAMITDETNVDARAEFQQFFDVMFNQGVYAGTALNYDGGNVIANSGFIGDIVSLVNSSAPASKISKFLAKEIGQQVFAQILGDFNTFTLGTTNDATKLLFNLYDLIGDGTSLGATIYDPTGRLFPSDEHPDFVNLVTGLNDYPTEIKDLITNELTTGAMDSYEVFILDNNGNVLFSEAGLQGIENAIAFIKANSVFNKQLAIVHKNENGTIDAVNIKSFIDQPSEQLAVNFGQFLENQNYDSSQVDYVINGETGVKQYFSNTVDFFSRVASDANITLDELIQISGNEYLADRRLEGANGGDIYLFRKDDKVSVAYEDNDFAFVNLKYQVDAQGRMIIGQDGTPLKYNPAAAFEQYLLDGGDEQGFMDITGQKLIDWVDDVGTSVNDFFASIGNLASSTFETTLSAFTYTGDFIDSRIQQIFGAGADRMGCEV